MVIEIFYICEKLFMCTYVDSMILLWGGDALWATFPQKIRVRSQGPTLNSAMILLDIVIPTNLTIIY